MSGPIELPSSVHGTERRAKILEGETGLLAVTPEGRLHMVSSILGPGGFLSDTYTRTHTLPPCLPLFLPLLSHYFSNLHHLLLCLHLHTYSIEAGPSQFDITGAAGTSIEAFSYCCLHSLPPSVRPPFLFLGPSLHRSRSLPETARYLASVALGSKLEPLVERGDDRRPFKSPEDHQRELL